MVSTSAAAPNEVVADAGDDDAAADAAQEPGMRRVPETVTSVGLGGGWERRGGEIFTCF
jgi:hypothetical protein